MARIGISITKTVSFRGSTQEFSNVYYYDGGQPLPNEAEALDLIDEIVTVEKTFHSTAVTFKRGRCWSQGATPAASEMIAQKNLSGTGSASTASSFDKERAYLFRLRAGVDSRGNPVYFRKWYHSCGNFGTAIAPAAGNLDQTTALTQAQRDAAVALMATLSTVGPAGGRTIVAKGGRTPTDLTSWQSHQWLEHHQLGDQWRAQ